MNANGQPLSTDAEWTFERIEAYDRAIAKIAAEYRLDTFANQIEIITSEQMMDAYAGIGMPINYHHWSFGKEFLQIQRHYQRGQMGLAYELVINSNPCIAYLLEENTMTMQALVIAHACYGHNSFFKGNYLFQTWTSPDAIIDYLVFARNYVAECEERHGKEAVELLLDSCHALMNQGVDRYRHPAPLSPTEEAARQEERQAYLQTQINDLWYRTVPNSRPDRNAPDKHERFPTEPQENLLYFLEKNAPLLEPWQREIIRVVRRFAQYLYPQRQTKVMNEGWACFWHYTLINALYERGLVTDGFMLEFLQAHTNVIYQPPFDHPAYGGINPYALGFAMFTDLRRVCEAPDDEDRHWFPDLAGSDWIETLDFAMRNFKDESFIQQYLSPKVIRRLRLFSLLDDDREVSLAISGIHDEQGYRHVRKALSEQYNLGNIEPNIQVYRVDLRGNRGLHLRHYRHRRRPLSKETHEMLRHVHRLWSFNVYLDAMEEKGGIVFIDEVNKIY